jgi:hypothetical protein
MVLFYLWSGNAYRSLLGYRQVDKGHRAMKNIRNDINVVLDERTYRLRYMWRTAWWEYHNLKFTIPIYQIVHSKVRQQVKFKGLWKTSTAWSTLHCAEIDRIYDIHRHRYGLDSSLSMARPIISISKLTIGYRQISVEAMNNFKEYIIHPLNDNATGLTITWMAVWQWFARPGIMPQRTYRRVVRGILIDSYRASWRILNIRSYIPCPSMKPIYDFNGKSHGIALILRLGLEICIFGRLTGICERTAMLTWCRYEQYPRYTISTDTSPPAQPKVMGITYISLSYGRDRCLSEIWIYVTYHMVGWLWIIWSIGSLTGWTCRTMTCGIAVWTHGVILSSIPSYQSVPFGSRFVGHIMNWQGYEKYSH